MKSLRWAAAAGALLMLVALVHPAAAARSLLAAKAPTKPPIANPPQIILFT